MIRVVSVEELSSLEDVTIHDLTVAVDASFIVADVVLHNSAICRALDGKVFAADDPHLPAPPRHPNCLPGDSLVLPRGRITAATKRWFDGDVVVLRTASGRELTCTPNHPVLSDAGWAPAQSLDLSSKVACDLGREWSGVAHDDDQDVPARIEDVAEAFFRSRDVAAVKVPLAAPDFHGDGVGSQVAIVGADRHLLAGDDALLGQHFAQPQLQLGDARQRDFAALRAGDQLLFICTGASPRCMCRAGQARPFFRGGAGHAGRLLLGATAGLIAGLPQRGRDGIGSAAVAFADPAQAHAGLEQGDDLVHRELRRFGVRWPQRLAPLSKVAVDSLAVDAELARNLIAGQAGPVLLDDVVHIERREFHGHVYNLQTEQNHYVANGIVTHNCRSVLVPKTKSWEDLLGPEGRALDEAQGEGSRPFVAATVPASQLSGKDKKAKVGQVPAGTTYPEWFARQPAAFQREVLGPARYEAYRAGLPLDAMATYSRELTVAELRALYPDKFAKGRPMTKSAAVHQLRHPDGRWRLGRRQPLDWFRDIDARPNSAAKVTDAVRRFAAGEHAPPIDIVIDAEGRRTLLDGHARLAAARQLGVPALGVRMHRVTVAFGKAEAEGRRKRKIRRVMHEWKTGTLRSGSGQPVTSFRQAVAIALSEAGRVAKADQPRWPKGSSKGGEFKPKGGKGGKGGAGDPYASEKKASPGHGGYSLFGGYKTASPKPGGAKTPPGPAATPPAHKPAVGGLFHGQGQSGGKAPSKPPVVYDAEGHPLPTHPTKPTPTVGNADPSKTAVYVKGHDSGGGLHGVPFSPWSAPDTPKAWNAVEGQRPDLDEPPLPELPEGKHMAAGVVVTEPDGRVWIVEPTNHFGGYQHTFPKGTQEDGIPSLQANAIKEAFEESGLKVRITDYLGDYERDTSIGRYYVAERVGGSPTAHGWETQAVKLVPPDQLKSFLNRKIDQAIADDIADYVAATKVTKAVGAFDFLTALVLRPGLVLKAEPPTGGGGDDDQPRWPKGSSKGGQFAPKGAHGGGGGAAETKAAPKKIKGKKKLIPDTDDPAAWMTASAANQSHNKAIKAIHEIYLTGDKAKLEDIAAGKLEAKQGYTVMQGEYAAYLGGKLATQKAAEIAHDQPLSFDASSWKKLSNQKGSNPGGMYEAPDGKKYYVKFAKSNHHAANEILGAKLLEAAGGGTLTYHQLDLGGGKKGVATEWSDKQLFDFGNPGHLKEAWTNFGPNAWIANWDVIGEGTGEAMNQALVAGKMTTMDTGGGLEFRAQGAPKGAAFGTKVGEFDTLRSKTPNPNNGKVFGAMTASDIWASVEPVSKVTDQQIHALVDKYGHGDQAAKDALAQKLIARRDDLTAQAKALLGEAPAKPEPKPEPKAEPAPEPAPAAAAGAPKPSKLLQQKAATNKAVGDSLAKLDAAAQTLDLAAAKAAWAPAEAKVQTGKDLVAHKAAVIAHIEAQLKAKQPAAAPAPEPASAPAPAPAPKTGIALPAKPTNAASAQQKIDQLEAAAKTALETGDVAPLLAIGTMSLPSMQYKAALVTALTGIPVKLSQIAGPNAVLPGGKPTATPEPKPELKPAPAPDADPMAAAVTHPTPVAPAKPGKPKKIVVTSASNLGQQKKFDELETLGEAGDVAALEAKVALYAGQKNSYSKQALAHAKDWLAYLKGGAVPGVEVPAPVAAKPAVAAPVATPTVEPVTAPAGPVTLNAAKLPTPPSFANWGGTGKPLSHNNPHFNTQNQAEVDHLYQLALKAIATGDTTELRDYKPGSPSKHVAGYQSQLLENIELQKNPPPVPPSAKIEATTAQTAAKQIDRFFPTKAIGTAVAKIKAAFKAGAYLILGKVEHPIPEPGLGIPGRYITDDEIKAGYTKWKQFGDQEVKDSIQTYKNSEWPNKPLRTGEGTYYAKARKIAQDAAKYAGDIPAGIRVRRGMWNKDLKIVETIKQHGAEGLILQEPGFFSTSYIQSESGKGFGGDIQWHVTVGPGVQAIEAWGSGSHGIEREMLFLPGQRFLIHRAETHGGEFHIFATALPTDLDVIKNME